MSHATAVLDQLKLAEKNGNLPDRLRGRLEELQSQQCHCRGIHDWDYHSAEGCGRDPVAFDNARKRVANTWRER